MEPSGVQYQTLQNSRTARDGMSTGILYFFLFLKVTYYPPFQQINIGLWSPQNMFLK